MLRPLTGSSSLVSEIYQQISTLTRSWPTVLGQTTPPYKRFRAWSASQSGDCTAERHPLAKGTPPGKIPNSTGSCWAEHAVHGDLPFEAEWAAVPIALAQVDDWIAEANAVLSA
jgi:hypothetical protein